jgi:hypothetical protein
LLRGGSTPLERALQQDWHASQHRPSGTTVLLVGLAGVERCCLEGRCPAPAQQLLASLQRRAGSELLALLLASAMLKGAVSACCDAQCVWHVISMDRVGCSFFVSWHDTLHEARIEGGTSATNAPTCFCHCCACLLSVTAGLLTQQKPHSRVVLQRLGVLSTKC